MCQMKTVETGGVIKSVNTSVQDVDWFQFEPFLHLESNDGKAWNVRRTNRCETLDCFYIKTKDKTM